MNLARRETVRVRGTARPRARQGVRVRGTPHAVAGAPAALTAA
jgi:hypothetical protein